MAQKLIAQRLTDFERTVWSAWIAQEILSANISFVDSAEVAARRGLDYLSRRRRNFMPPMAARWSNTREDCSIENYKLYLSKLIGDPLQNSGEADALYVSNKLCSEKKTIATVFIIVQCLLYLKVRSSDGISLNKARLLAGRLTKLSQASVNRCWRHYGRAAHLIFGVMQVYDDPSVLVQDAFSFQRYGKKHDVEDILAAAKFAKSSMLDMQHTRSRGALGVPGLVKGMVEPESFAFSKLNTSAIHHIERRFYQYLPNDEFIKLVEQHLSS